MAIRLQSLVFPVIVGISVAVLGSCTTVLRDGLDRPESDPGTFAGRWLPPDTRVGGEATTQERLQLERYLSRLSRGSRIVTADELSALYLERVTEEIGYPPVEGSALTVSFLFTIEEIPSNQNFYARGRLVMTVEIEGDSATLSDEVVGRSVISPLSVYDAGMNSLLAIPSDELAQLAEDLRLRLERRLLDIGLEYRFDGIDDEHVLRVVRAVARQDGDRWRSFLSPQSMSDRLEDYLRESPYELVSSATKREFIFVRKGVQ